MRRPQISITRAQLMAKGTAITRKSHKTPFILTILITLLLAASILTVPILRAADHVRIIRIADGDTIVVNFKGNNEKVRFLCVNTPESIHPDRRQNIPKGKIASDYTEKRLKGKYVDLEFEGPFKGR
jgi:endonuclease YncB( thermonuclease family)